MSQFYTTAYLASDGYEVELQRELADAGIVVAFEHHGLLITASPPVASVWAANIWHDVVSFEATSIGDAARGLRALQRNWAVYAPDHAGRARLIEQRLPHVSGRALDLGESAPAAPLGSWTLLTPNRVLASTRCSSPFPNGVPRLVEDREGPPSRAYLKLWEALLLLDWQPTAGDRCIDLGASPGGWTWLLATLGAEVVAVDKAPLADRVAAVPGVSWLQGSAFAIDPLSVGPIDLMVCDVIAYPKRTLAVVERWLPHVGAIVSTVKFQGDTDHDAVCSFVSLAATVGGRVVHLAHNKHELTFLFRKAAS